jgi:hypothetical protein
MMLEDLIVKINQNFAGTHPLQSSIDPDFAFRFAGNTGIKFVLARIDPSGNPHSGLEKRNKHQNHFLLTLSMAC